MMLTSFMQLGEGYNVMLFNHSPTMFREGLPRNVSRLASGNFQVRVRIAGKTQSFGAYATVKEADKRAREVRALRESGGDLMAWRKKHCPKRNTNTV